jgi:uncharacterized protein
VKLVVAEPETQALQLELATWARHVSSVVVDVEVRRAAYREQVPVEQAAAMVELLSLIPLDDELRRLAGEAGSRVLRSLDAIHLASALSLGDDLGAFCCYDARLRADAEAAGLTVLSPGLD